jgi:hypothetical protein
MKERMIEQKNQVKAKAVAHKDTLQLIWRAYQGLILAALVILFLGQ